MPEPMNESARDRMDRLAAWLTGRRGQLLWSLADNGRDFHRRVDFYSTPSGAALVVTTQIGDAVTWSVYAEAGPGRPHIERLDCIDAIHGAVPAASVPVQPVPEAVDQPVVLAFTPPPTRIDEEPTTLSFEAAKATTKPKGALF